jgi:hypothetical protein
MRNLHTVIPGRVNREPGIHSPCARDVDDPLHAARDVDATLARVPTTEVSVRVRRRLLQFGHHRVEVEARGLLPNRKLLEAL